MSAKYDGSIVKPAVPVKHELGCPRAAVIVEIVTIRSRLGDTTIPCTNGEKLALPKSTARTPSTGPTLGFEVVNVWTVGSVVDHGRMGA